MMGDDLDDLAGYFAKCGYPGDLVNPILSSVLESPRSLEYKTKTDNKSFHVPVKIPYGMGAKELQGHINGPVNESLMKAPVFQGSGIPIVKTVFTKGRSLKSLLFKQKLVTLGNDGSDVGMSVRCTSEEEAKHKRGP